MDFTRRKFISWCTGLLLFSGTAANVFASSSNSLRKKIEKLYDLIKRNYDEKIISSENELIYKRTIHLTATTPIRYDGKVMIEYQQSSEPYEKNIELRYFSDDDKTFYGYFDQGANGLDNIINGKQEDNHIAKFSYGGFNFEKCGIFTTHSRCSEEIRFLDNEYEMFLDILLESGKLSRQGARKIIKR